MLLINRNKKTKDLEPHYETAESETMDPKKSSKFNFGGFFKKKLPTIPNISINKPKSDDTEGELDPTISGDDKPKVVENNSSASDLPPISVPSTSILDDANHITVIPSNESAQHTQSSLVQQRNGQHHSHTHHTSHQSQLFSNTSSNYQERYTSFTSDCISLQNSEMTSHMDEDSHKAYSPIGKRLFDDEVPTHKKSSLRSILKNRTESLKIIVPDQMSQGNSDMSKQVRSDDDDDDDNEQDDDALDTGDEMASDDEFTNQEDLRVRHFDNRSQYSRAEESETDIVAYLSETESDFNFDPLQEENADDYKIGGYHPVVKGETYYSQSLPNREYIILRKLGWGHFSTVWLAKSIYNPKLGMEDYGLDSREEYYVAIKFVKSSKCYIEAAEDEINLLQVINRPLLVADHLTEAHKEYFRKFHFNKENEPTGHPGFKHVMKLLDNFQISGPNGKHICMVFEVLGENVFNLMCKYKKLYSNINDEFNKKEFTTAGPSGVLGGILSSTTTSNGNGKSSGGGFIDSFNAPFLFSKKKNDKAKKSTVSKLSLGLVSSGGQDTKSESTSADSSIKQKGRSSSTSSSSADDILLSQEQTKRAIDSKIQSLDSKSLQELMEHTKTYGGLPLALVKQIFKQIFLAMDYIHHCGVIHTDLKPENILIEIQDITKLIKFFETEKIAKHNERKRSSSIKTITDPTPDLSRRTSNHSSKSNRSNNSFVSGYRHSRISISGRRESGYHDSPIRSSKPLPSPITTDIMFNNVSYKFNDGPKIPIDNVTHSPTDTIKNSLQSNAKSINGNSVEGNFISIKIADLGNGTFAHEHFTNQIQTRQYRSPEIILGHSNWGASTDIWSIGCMIFELITGDYLFDPHNGKSYDRDDDHMAQIIELMGDFPSREYLSKCSFTNDYFKISSNNIRFRKIPHLKFWPLKDVLVEKYHFNKDDPNVALIADLISKCLQYEPENRFEAGALSNHPWFNNCGDNDTVEVSPLAKGEDVPGFSSTYVVQKQEEECEECGDVTLAFY
ncbi:hypothetical protein CAAN3_04S05006 [[Candida] anglica]